MSDGGVADVSAAIHNERVKLSAGALDRASTACLTVGVLGPIVAFLYGFGPSGTGAAGGLLAAGSLFWLAAAAGLHWLARRVLGGLR